MVIVLKSEEEIRRMKGSNRIVAELLEHLENFIKPDVTTAELDRIAYEFILKKKPNRLLKDIKDIRQHFVLRLMSRLFMGYLLKESCGKGIL